MRERRRSREKKRRRRRSSAEGESKRRSPEFSNQDQKEETDGPVEAAEELSDVEEGGLDLNVPFKPISAFVSDRQEMLEQSFRVLGEDKLRKMLPDELKSCSMLEIRTLCWDQLQQLSQRSLLQILEGKELIATSETEENEDQRDSVDSQQDNNVDSTSSVKETEDKQGGSGDESDVLSINADVDDSDIEGLKDDKPAAEEAPVTAATAPSASAPPPKPGARSAEPKLELQHDIDKSVSEILALTAPPSCQAELELPVAAEAPPPSHPAATPSAQQLALLELEMRARAIKALMKANELKK